MDLAAELMKLDWSYTFKDGNKFISNEQAFDQCATFRLINNAFRNPFVSEIELQKKTNTVQVQENIPKTKDSINRGNTLNKVINDSQNQNAPQQTPKYATLFPDKSILNSQQHQLALKVLSYFMKNGQVVSFAGCLPDATTSEINKFNNTILPLVNEERHKFANFVNDMWVTNKCSRYLNIDPNHKSFVKEVWKYQIGALNQYPQHYQSATMIPLLNQTDEPVDLDKIKVLKRNVNYGPKLFIPDLTKHFDFTKHCDEIRMKQSMVSEETKFSVINDYTCENFAKDHMADIVVSPKTLQCIMSNMVPFNKSWNIPFTIKGYQMKDSKGKEFTHTVAYLNSPLPHQSLSIKQKKEWMYKMLLTDALFNSDDIPQQQDKCDFCNTTVISNNTPISSSDDNIDDDVFMKSEDEDSDDESKLVMDVDESAFSVSFPEGVTTRSKSIKSNCSAIKACDPIVSSQQKTAYSSGILTRSKTSKNSTMISETVSTEERKNVKKHKLIEAMKCTCNKNYSKKNRTNGSVLSTDDFTYSLWKLHHSSEVSLMSKTAKKEVVMLVRSKGDGWIESKNSKDVCILEPKLEYQTEFGCECTTPLEAATQSTLLNFNPDSKLFRVRVCSTRKNILMIEKFDSRTYTSEIAKQSAWTMTKAKSILFNIFSELSKIRPGEYLLSHEEKHGSFAVIYTSAPKGCSDGFDLKEAYNINMSEIKIIQSAPWTPIDCTLPTPLQLKCNIMPCMFNPSAKRFYVDKSTSRQKNKFPKTFATIKKGKNKNKRKKKKSKIV